MTQLSPVPLPLSRKQLVSGIALLVLALLAFGPSLGAHPLMDDHLFFAWLEQTPWPEATWQRLTGNWIPYFNQMQMYRPASGIVQVLAYQLFGTWSLPHHLLNLVLHCLTGFLAGILTFRLTQNSGAGWCAAALLLLHPRGGLGVSLIYNFYDPLVGCLLLIALLCLWSLKFQSARGRVWRYLGLWGSVAWALGSKESALPLAGVLLLADLLWNNTTVKVKSLLCRHGIPVASLALYLVARANFVGHPFRTHAHPSAFPLPPRSELWAFLWSGLLLAFCVVGAIIIQRWPRAKAQMPPQSAWMLLWCGLMLWPAVHFCSQVTLRPWFFDERYWYVPLVPMSVFSGSLLLHGGMVSSLLGSALVAVTFPLPLGPLLAAMLFFISGPLQLLHRDEEIRSFVLALFAVALAIILGTKCGEIRLRADEAATIQQQIGRVVWETPAGGPVVLLNFSEETVEPRRSLNGTLQWLIQPPFFSEDLNARLFFAYPTWDSPPTNRFRDRTTPELVGPIYQRRPVHVYLWNTQKRELEFVKVSKEMAGLELGAVSPLPMEPASQTEANRSWSSSTALDPKNDRHIAIQILVEKPLPPLKDLGVTIGWFSDGFDSSLRRDQPLSRKTERLLFPSGELGKMIRRTPAEVTVWFSPGNYVDWLFGGNIARLEIAPDDGFRVLAVQLFSRIPEKVFQEALRLTHYRHPERSFLQVGESWWVLEH
jgi:hypothetical protein